MRILGIDPGYETLGWAVIDSNFKILGYGKAAKEQVQVMITKIFGIKEIPKPDDAADAIAIAVCCALSKMNFLCY